METAAGEWGWSHGGGHGDQVRGGHGGGDRGRGQVGVADRRRHRHGRLLGHIGDEGGGRRGQQVPRHSSGGRRGQVVGRRHREGRLRHGGRGTAD